MLLNDIDLYNKYHQTDTPSDTLLETEYSPMHPGLFYNLSQHKHFSDTHGYTYEEYIFIYKKKYNIIDIEVISVIYIDENKIPSKLKLENKAFFNSQGKIILPHNCYTLGYFKKLLDKIL